MSPLHEIVNEMDPDLLPNAARFVEDISLQVLAQDANFNYEEYPNMEVHSRWLLAFVNEILAVRYEECDDYTDRLNSIMVLWPAEYFEPLPFDADIVDIIFNDINRDVFASLVHYIAQVPLYYEEVVRRLRDGDGRTAVVAFSVFRTMDDVKSQKYVKTLSFGDVMTTYINETDQWSKSAMLEYITENIDLLVPHIIMCLEENPMDVFVESTLNILTLMYDSFECQQTFLECVKLLLPIDNFECTKVAALYASKLDDLTKFEMFDLLIEKMVLCYQQDPQIANCFNKYKLSLTEIKRLWKLHPQTDLFLRPMVPHLYDIEVQQIFKSELNSETYMSVVEHLTPKTPNLGPLLPEIAKLLDKSEHAARIMTQTDLDITIFVSEMVNASLKNLNVPIYQRLLLHALGKVECKELYINQIRPLLTDFPHNFQRALLVKWCS